MVNAPSLAGHFGCIIPVQLMRHQHEADQELGRDIVRDTCSKIYTVGLGVARSSSAPVPPIAKDCLSRLSGAPDQPVPAHRAEELQFVAIVGDRFDVDDVVVRCETADDRLRSRAPAPRVGRET